MWYLVIVLKRGVDNLWFIICTDCRSLLRQGLNKPLTVYIPLPGWSKYVIMTLSFWNAKVVISILCSQIVRDLLETLSKGLTLCSPFSTLSLCVMFSEQCWRACWPCAPHSPPSVCTWSPWNTAEGHADLMLPILYPQFICHLLGTLLRGILTLWSPFSTLSV